MTVYTYIPNFISNPDALFTALWNDIPWEKREDAPRRECWMNDFNRPYTYGRGAGQRTYQASPWNADILAVRQKLADEQGCFLEACFTNGYEHSRHALGWHADDDVNIDHSRPIAVISLGAERAIQVRENGSPDIQSILLGNGSLFLMHPGMQQTHQHKIPKHFKECGPRISLTFRGLFS